MKPIIINIFFCIILFSCSNTKETYKTEKDTKYENIKGEKVVTEEVIETIRIQDQKTVTRLTKISNYSNDDRIKYLTGQSANGGLQDYLLDSIFYNQKGHDTLKISYVKLNTEWQAVQLFKKKYNDFDSIIYWETERPFKPNHYYRHEIHYSYNTSNKLISKSEFECRNKSHCDSILKITFDYYNSNTEETHYIYRNNMWEKLKIK